MNTTQLGRLGEAYAVRHLKRAKYRILEKNIHISHNEIDIIAKNKEYIVFVEVKTRTTDIGADLYFGTPASAVTRDKKQRTVQAARRYLANLKYKKLQPRFDVIEIYLDKSTNKPISVNHIENAFGA